MNVLGIIPARGGSKAIPRKNIVLLGGKSLLAWTAEAASASQLNQIIVSTDDEEIASHAEACGIEVPFLRPAAIAGDDAATIDVVLHALDELATEFDAVMVLQPTSPFRTVADIDACLLLLNNSDADSVISVVDVGGHHPARMKFLKDGILVDPPFGEQIENQSRQDLTPMYIRNGAIYLTRTHVIQAGTFKGRVCLAHVMPPERSINIDEPLDLAIAEAMVNHQ